jgi:hypothetical protein
MPRAELNAGWHPRSPHGSRIRRPAPPERRLGQQPAGDSTEESQSRAMKTKALQRLFHRKWVGPDKNDRGQGRE